MNIKQFSSVVTIFSSKKLKKCKINKSLSIENVHIHAVPQCIKESEALFNGMDNVTFSSKYSEMVNLFIETIIEKMPHVKLQGFYHNMQKFRFEKANFIEKIFSPEAASCDYIPNEGTHIIRFVRYDIVESIYHELLHLASMKEKGLFYFSGFKQEKEGEHAFEIGIGLNEGYTSLLTGRYFDEFGADSDDYLPLKHISKIIESFVGKESMETMYFNANLYGLVQTLENLDNEREILLFLKKWMF